MEETRQEAIEKLRELTKGIDICMLTTNDGGVLRSRPNTRNKNWQRFVIEAVI